MVCALASTAFTVLTLVDPCFVGLASVEVLHLPLASPMLHLPLPAHSPLVQLAPLGHLLGSPWQQVAGHGVACAVCAFTFEASAEDIGQGPQSALFDGVQLPPQASKAEVAPSASINARESDNVRMYFFKTNSLKRVPRFSVSYTLTTRSGGRGLLLNPQNCRFDDGVDRSWRGDSRNCRYLFCPSL